MPRGFRLLPLTLLALAACQAAPPVAEAPPATPEPVEYEPAAEQLEQVFNDGAGKSDYVPLALGDEDSPRRISPETIALANEISGERPARPRALQRSAAGLAAAPTEETYLLPKAKSRDGTLANKGAPLEIGEAVALDVNPYSGGTWITEGANQFWVLRLQSVGASSLSLYFRPLRLPAGSELSLASPDGATRHGPYTAADLQGRTEFWTPGVPGETAVLRLKLPPAGRSGLQLNLAQARIGYRAE